MTVTVTTTSVDDPVGDTLDRAVGHLLSLQSPEGWWKGELETNVTMDAEDLLFREFLGIRTAEQTAQSAAYIRSRQQPDGTWAIFHGGPAELSTTIEAYVALKLAGDDPSADHMRHAAAYIREHGGIPGARVFTRFWLAFFGWWSWDDLPEMPPELILLPSWAPLNVYEFGCWARQTIVPLTIASALRPVRPQPFPLDELDTDVPPQPRKTADDAWSKFFHGLDKVLHAYHKKPLQFVRRFAMKRAAQWIIERQEADGGWGGIQPPWVYSLIALHLMGYPLNHPVMAQGIKGLDGFTVIERMPDGTVQRRFEACQSPVWDTGLSLVALRDANVPADHPQVVAAADWLVDEEVLEPKGDWAVKRPGLEPGGWAFEFANDYYPDTDDTAEIVLALRYAGSSRDKAATLGRAERWTAGMRSADGGWGAFDADNTAKLPLKLPFCDFGEVIDPPSADVTAHIVEMFAESGGYRDEVRSGVKWLLENQEADGSWFGRWGANFIYGTGAVVPALTAAGVDPSHPAVRRAVQWLINRQNTDGGWGEDLRSYADPAVWSGRGDSTASQTAWALLAMLAAGERDTDSVRRAVAWLAETQNGEGGWDEPQFTGTGFPGDFYIKYHMYRIVFPIMALGRYARSGH